MGVFRTRAKALHYVGRTSQHLAHWHGLTDNPRRTGGNVSLGKMQGVSNLSYQRRGILVPLRTIARIGVARIEDDRSKLTIA